MTSDQVVAILRHYNAWRRDDALAVKMPEPRVVGEAIDAAIHLLSSRKSAKNRRGAKREMQTGGGK